ncbi:MAG: GNAT family N-acetyltransferase [Clostridia bacterium]|nr:GNAT family N-acetyltransferase [Clostridia bacterium]
MKQIAEHNEKPELMALYNICFPGEEDYCKRFFDCVWEPAKTLVYKTDGKIVSMLHMIDITITDGCEEYSAYYIFGAATHPDYRGKSVMRELLQYSEEINCRKDFAVLIAGNDGLTEYYGRSGYQIGFSCGKRLIRSSVSHVPHQMFDFSKLSLKESEKVLDKMNDIYLKSFGSEVICKRTPELLFSDLYCREAVVFMADNCYAVAEISNDEIVFAECAGENSTVLASYVLYERGLTEGAAYTSGSDISLGMYKNIACKKAVKGYLNLLFN